MSSVPPWANIGIAASGVGALTGYLIQKLMQKGTETMTKLEMSLMHVVAQLVEKIDLLTKESDELKKRPTEGEFSYYRTEAERLRDENKKLRGELELIRQASFQQEASKAKQRAKRAVSWDKK